jgi:hypothetical protein
MREVDRLREADPLAFERFIARLWSRDGWNTEVTPQHGGDGGCDVIADRDGTRMFIECKRYADGNWVGVGTIGQVLRARAKEPKTQWDRVVAAIVTTSEFTPTCREEAREILDFRLYNHEKLQVMINRLDGSELIDDIWDSKVWQIIRDRESDGYVSLVDVQNSAHAYGLSNDDVSRHLGWLEDHGRIVFNEDGIWVYDEWRATD